MAGRHGLYARASQKCTGGNAGGLAADPATCTGADSATCTGSRATTSWQRRLSSQAMQCSGGKAVH